MRYKQVVVWLQLIGSLTTSQL